MSESKLRGAKVAKAPARSKSGWVVLSGWVPRDLADAFNRKRTLVDPSLNKSGAVYAAVRDWVKRRAA